MRRFAINPKLVQKIVNNLPEVQKRHMQRAAQAVAEYATANPGRTIAEIGSVIGYVTYSHFHAQHMVAHTDSFLEVHKQELEVQKQTNVVAEKEAEATTRYAEVEDKSRQDTNSVTAEEQMMEAVTEEYFKLKEEQFRTGEIRKDEVSLSIIREELKVRKEKN